MNIEDLILPYDHIWVWILWGWDKNRVCFLLS